MNKWILYLLALTVFSSCKTLGKLNIKVERNLLNEVIENKLADQKEKYFLCDRVSVQIGDDETKSLHAKVFIVTGQSIFISLSYLLGIELGRIQITHDSIKYINRIKREYYFGEIRFLTKLAGVNFDYEEIENFIIKGIPINSKDSRKRILLRFTESDTDYIYNYGIESNKFVKIYFEKTPLQEYKIEFSDHLNKFYFIGYLDNYLSEPSYPGVIKATILRSGKETDLKLFINKIENKDFQNTSFKVNNNYNELVF